jgi:hypothetical protein
VQVPGDAVAVLGERVLPDERVQAGVLDGDATTSSSSSSENSSADFLLVRYRLP